MPRIATSEPTPRNVLLVADGLSPQEDDIENHFLDLGWETARTKDYRVNGATSFDEYDLVVLFESSPFVPPCGIDALKASGVPVLLFETLSFQYAYRLGLTTTPLPGLASDDTIYAVREGYDDFTSRVGAEALVYQPQALIFGVTANRLKPGVTPIFASDGCVSRVPVFADYARKIAATGLTDTAKFTVDAWKMLDILVSQLLPVTAQRYTTLDDVAQAYYDSGLYAFADEVAEDLKRDQTSWTYEEAEKEAWLLVQEWGLDELWDYTTVQLGDVLGITVTIPPMHFYSLHPERPTGNGPSYLSDTTEEELWFLGGYWEKDPSTGLYDVVDDDRLWSDYLRGTDLGMSAVVGGRRVFYMGDTWDSKTKGTMWSTARCTSPAVCNDMIVVSADSSPENGIDASPVFEGTSDHWTPLVIPGVHREFSPQLHIPGDASMEFWDGSGDDPAFTAPSGVVATWLPGHIVFNGYTTDIKIRGVMVWYGTATAPYGSDGQDPLDSSDPKHRPASWAGCSIDGIHFYACYRDSAGDAVPFSVDHAPPDNALAGEASIDVWKDTHLIYPATGYPARFLHVAAVRLEESDFAEACAEYSSSCLCDTSLYPSGTTPRSGLLLYGSGRPYRKSGLFMAFIRDDDTRQVDSNGRPIVYYRTGGTTVGSQWSRSEAVAASLSGTPPCSKWLEPNWDQDKAYGARTAGCWPELQGWDGSLVFGEMSARLIRSTAPSQSAPSRIVLLNTSFDGVLAWTPPLATPASGFDDADNWASTKTVGYGPYIIDGLGDETYTGSGAGGSAVLWHTISVWWGDFPPTQTPYGVYTGSEVITWQ